MADLDVLFNEATVIGSTSFDDPEYLEIGHDFRTITIPSSKNLLGVVNDNRVNVLYFRCPRYYGPIDLSTFEFRINYKNANGEPDIYTVFNKSFDEENIEFTWVVSRHAFKYVGDVSFVVCARLVENGAAVREYNTTVQSLPVIVGLEVDTAFYRATTPKHTFKFTDDPETNYKSILISYAQNGQIILEKTKEDLTFATVKDDDQVTILYFTGTLQLSQEDTNLFVADADVTIQIRALNDSNDVFVSNTIILSVNDVLNDEVLT